MEDWNRKASPCDEFFQSECPGERELGLCLRRGFGERVSGENLSLKPICHDFWADLPRAGRAGSALSILLT